MMKIRLAVAALIIAGLASPTISVSAKSHKHYSKQSSMAKAPNTKSGMTTGANSKPSSANPSSQGNVGPGTNHAGSMPDKQ